MDPGIGLIFWALVASAWFSGTEIAFLTANRLRVELENQRGLITARILSFLFSQPSRFIGTLLVGNNIAVVLYGLGMSKILGAPVRDFLHQWGLDGPILQVAVQSALATLLVLITAEFLPKILFRLNPNGILRFTAPVNLLFYVLLFPITWVIVSLSQGLLKAFFGFRISDSKPIFGRIDLDHYIEESEDYRNASDTEDTGILILKNALAFRNVKVRECMVPRTEIEAVDLDQTAPASLKKKFVETGFSRIMAYRKNIDNIIGFIPLLGILRQPGDVESLLIPVPVVPETMAARDLLNQFMQERKSIAVVVDEHGGTAGIVTMEDVVEEIFGEIQDEHDEEELPEKMIRPGEYILSGRHEVDYLNKKYQLQIPEGDYETLGGFVFNGTGKVPELNEILELPPFRIRILSLRNNRIEKVILLNGKEKKAF